MTYNPPMNCCPWILRFSRESWANEVGLPKKFNNSIEIQRFGIPAKIVLSTIICSGTCTNSSVLVTIGTVWFSELFTNALVVFGEDWRRLFDCTVGTVFDTISGSYSGIVSIWRLNGRGIYKSWKE